MAHELLTPSFEVCKINLVTPTYDELCLEFTVFKDVTTVHDLMLHICERKLVNMVEEEMIFIHKHSMMNPKNVLYSYLLGNIPVTGTITISIIRRMIPEQMTEKNFPGLLYSEFIKSSYPIQNSVDVPLNSEITIKFGKSSLRNIEIYIPAMLNLNALKCSSDGDMVKNVGGLKEATNRGFKKWTNETFEQRIFLLELPTENNGFSFTEYSHLERIRYYKNGVMNRGYDNGDYHSWQRYTKYLPILCTLSHTTDNNVNCSDSENTHTSSNDVINCSHSHSDDVIRTIKMTPHVPMKSSTYYSILLCNNVPTVPKECSSNDFMQFISNSISEDHLICFKTKSK